MPTRRAHVQRAFWFRIPATPLSRVAIWLVGAYALVQGLSILLTNPARWEGPSFATLQTMWGAPASWGASATVFGVLILAGSLGRWWWVKAAGLVLLSSWAFVFGAGVLQAVVRLPSAATTAIPTYALIGLWAATLIWVDEGPRHADPPLRP